MCASASVLNCFYSHFIVTIRGARSFNLALIPITLTILISCGSVWHGMSLHFLPLNLYFTSCTKIPTNIGSSFLCGLSVLYSRNSFSCCYNIYITAMYYTPVWENITWPDLKYYRTLWPESLLLGKEITRTLRWLQLQFRVDFEILLLMLNTLPGLAPSYITELLSPYKRIVAAWDHREGHS